MNNRTKGIAFEQYVRQILESNGIITQSTIASNDYGADILFDYQGYRFVVQCKCLSGAAGIKPVQEVIGAISYYHAHYGIVVTNTFYTQQASNLAYSTGVLLVDNAGLTSIKSLIDHFFFSSTEGKILFTYFLFLLEKSPCDQRLSPLRRRSSPLRPVLSGRFCRPGDRSPFFTPGSSRYFIRLRKLGTQFPGRRKTSCRKCFHSRACFL